MESQDLGFQHLTLAALAVLLPSEINKYSTESQDVCSLERNAMVIDMNVKFQMTFSNSSSNIDQINSFLIIYF